MTTDDLLLTDREVAAMLGVSPSTVWRRSRNGTLPRPIRLGGLSRWPRSEIVAVVERAKAQREAAKADLDALLDARAPRPRDAA